MGEQGGVPVTGVNKGKVDDYGSEIVRPIAPLLALLAHPPERW